MEMCADWRQIEPSSSALHEVASSHPIPTPLPHCRYCLQSLSMGANFRKLGEVLKEVQVFQDSQFSNFFRHHLIFFSLS